jgi:hypothetical protein
LFVWVRSWQGVLSCKHVGECVCTKGKGPPLSLKRKPRKPLKYNGKQHRVFASQPLSNVMLATQSFATERAVEDRCYWAVCAVTDAWLLLLLDNFAWLFQFEFE